VRDGEGEGRRGGRLDESERGWLGKQREGEGREVRGGTREGRAGNGGGKVGGKEEGRQEGGKR